ncbi:DUF202 domain-containing protein [Nocardia sp. NPDC049190]|uniref:DUF202 domain-containing protein n=1 Tax=Nocardia sp. NPDC049190 TaxID=3155650 RepID=UPI0033F563E7
MSRPGLAAERTALAWRRTAVAAMVVGVLFLDHAAVGGWRPATIAPLCAAITSAVLAGTCYMRNRRLQEGRDGHGDPIVAATTMAVFAIAIVAVAIGLTDPLP